MLAKSASAFLSAVTLSAIFTLYEGSAGYSFIHGFATGSMVLAAFYLLAGIPLSAAADFMVRRSRHRFVKRLLLCFALGAGFGLVFLLAKELFFRVRLEAGSMIEAAVLFGFGGAVFACYESLTGRMINLLKH